VHLVDLHATILDLAGLTALQPTRVMPADGISLLPVLESLISLDTPIRAQLWIADDVLRIGDYKLITGAGTNSLSCMLGLNGDPVGNPIDPTNLSTYCGHSHCTGRETGADALICSECKCQTYNTTYDPENHCTPCVFNVRVDPSERVNLAKSTDPVDVARLGFLTARLLELRKTSYTPGIVLCTPSPLHSYTIGIVLYMPSPIHSYTIGIVLYTPSPKHSYTPLYTPSPIHSYTIHFRVPTRQPGRSLWCHGGQRRLLWALGSIRTAAATASPRHSLQQHASVGGALQCTRHVRVPVTRAVLSTLCE
jgi:hypothetical protein